MLSPQTKVKVLLLLLLATVALSIDGNCQALRTQMVLVTLPNERQFYNLSDFFRGYSLSYQIHSESPDKFTLYRPFKLINMTEVEQPVRQGQTRVTLDILTDSNLAWRQQGSSLVRRSLNRISVQFGQLSKYMHLSFTANIDIELEENSWCFDISSLEENITLVDCQMVREGEPIDFHYIINLTSGISTKYVHESFSQSTINSSNALLKLDRKTMLYNMEDRWFLLTAALLTIDNVGNPSTPIPTYVTVYELDAANGWKPQLMQVIDQDTLCIAGRLSLTDITIDAQNYIYLADLKAMAFRFRYSPSKMTVVDLTTFAEDVGASWHKIAAIYDFRGRTTVMIGSTDSIVELDWSRTSSNGARLVQRYEVPINMSRMQDLQVNREVMVLQADNFFYFYRRDLIRRKYMLCVNETFGALCMLDQVTPNALVLGNEYSLSYTVSSGYLSVEDPQQNENLTLIATSLDVSCEVQVMVKSVSDASHVIELRSLLNYSYETPAQLSLALDDFFIGPRLQYSVETSPEVTSSIRHVERVNIVLPDQIKQQFSLVDTFVINNTAYYRMAVDGSLVHVDICIVTLERSDTYVCSPLHDFQFDSDVALTRLEPMLQFQSDHMENIALLSCVLVDVPNMLHFREIGSGRIRAGIVLNETNNITSFALNSEFVVAASEAQQMVWVYRATPNEEYSLIINITYDSLKEQLPMLQTFDPLGCEFAPWDPNLLFILNIDAVLVLKMTSGGITVLSTIVLEKEFREREWTIVVSNVFVLLLVQENRTEILEYSLVDLYDPFLLRSISLLGSVVSTPLHLHTSSNSLYVYIKTHYRQEDDIFYGISVVKLATPAISSLYSYIELPSSHFGLASVELSDSTMVEVLDRQYNHSQRIYFRPMLDIEASINSSIPQKNLSLRLEVACPTERLKFDTTLRLINFQLPLAATYGDDIVLSLNVSEVGNSASYLLAEDKLNRELFKGSVGDYSLQCGKQLTDCSIDGPIRSFQSMPIKEQYVQYMSFEDGQALRTLDAQGFIHSYHLLTNQLISVSEPSVHQSDPTTQCLNWAFFRSDNTSEYVVVYCRNSTNQYFVLYIFESTYYPDFKKIWLISDKDWIGYPLKMEIVKNRLFILDGSSTGPTNGTIQVHRMNTVLLTMEWERVIDITDFGKGLTEITIDSARINDFEVLPTWNWSSSWLMLLVTIDNIGLAYGFFDPFDQAVMRLDPRGVLQLVDDPTLAPHQMFDSKFLQIELVKVDSVEMEYDVVVTVSHGRHLQLHLKYDPVGKLLWNLIAVYRKYGSLVPNNWARGINKDFNTPADKMNFTHLLVSYRDERQVEEVQNNILALHKIDSADDQNEVIGVLKVPRQGFPTAANMWYSQSTKTTFLAISYPNEMRFYSIHAGVELIFTHTVGSTVELSYTLSTNVKITASNLLHSVTATLPIDIAVNIPPLPEQVKWYVLLSMLIGTMVLLTGIVFYCRYRKRKLNRNKALSEQSIRTSLTNESVV